MISPVPCLADNYAYLIPNGLGGALVVDPGEAEPVRDALAELRLELAGILCTHHHRDHVGGNAQLAKPGVDVVGHASDRDRIPHLTRTVEDGEVLEVAGVTLRVLHVPGHTLGAVAYWLEGALFTGDTLFCAGCGRLFEGTAEQLYASLIKIVTTVPKDTVIYTGHEYTARNLRFARAALPDNREIELRAELVAQRRERGLYCASSTISEEMATNPFLRVHLPEVRRAVGLWETPPEQGSPEQGSPELCDEASHDQRVFRALRKWKDTL